MMVMERKVGIMGQVVRQLGVTASSSYTSFPTIPIMSQNRVIA